MLTEEQTSAIKKQLMEHIEKSFPEDKKNFAKEQVEHMGSKELEEFLAKNNLVSGQDSQCVFCSIVSGDIPSHLIEENTEAIAVLEINPISKGHSLIIPKKHLKEESEIPEEAKNLAKQVEKRIKLKLKPKKIEIIPSVILGHSIINLLPIYNNESISSKRQPAKKDDLEEVEKLLKKKPEEIALKPKTSKKKSLFKKAEEVIEQFEEKLWLPQRIP